MFTFAYTDVLLTILTLCVVLITALLVPVVLRLRQVLARLEAPVAKLDALIPDVERLAEEGEHAIRSLRALTDAAGTIAEDIGSVTGATRDLAMPLIQQVSTSVDATQATIRHLSALAVGTKAGIAALHRIRSGNDKH